MCCGIQLFCIKALIAVSARESLPLPDYLQLHHLGRLASWPQKLGSKPQSTISRKQQDIIAEPSGSYCFQRLRQPLLMWVFSEKSLVRIPCICTCCSVTKSCQNLWNIMDCSTPGSSVLHYLLEFSQIHIH